MINCWSNYETKHFTFSFELLHLTLKTFFIQLNRNAVVCTTSKIYQNIIFGFLFVMQVNELHSMLPSTGVERPVSSLHFRLRSCVNANVFTRMTFQFPTWHLLSGFILCHQWNLETLSDIQGRTQTLNYFGDLFLMVDDSLFIAEWAEILNNKLPLPQPFSRKNCLTRKNKTNENCPRLCYMVNEISSFLSCKN